MAEDEAAENNLIDAIERVHQMPWPKLREAALWRALTIIAKLLNLEIVKLEQEK